MKTSTRGTTVSIPERGRATRRMERRPRANVGAGVVRCGAPPAAPQASTLVSARRASRNLSQDRAWMPEAHGGTFFWLVLTKGLLTRGASESGRRRDASIPSRAMPAETTTGRLPAVAMEGRDIPALDYGKLLDLFHGKHSAGLHDRHAAAIARVCRAHAGGFPIRDLPSIERIVRFAYDRVAQGLVGEFEEALVLVMRCGSRPASTAHSPTCDNAPFPPSSSPLIAHDAHPHRSRSSLSA
jgi:hypothetical protein